MADEEGQTDLDAATAEAEALARMGNLSIEQVIRAGHEAMLRLLVAKSSAGTITHQEMAILRNLLRDNGMILGVPPKELEDNRPPQAPLPDLPPPDYED